MKLSNTISLPIFSIALLVGICITLVLVTIPSALVAYALISLALVVFFLQPHKVIQLLCVVLGGFGFMVCNINQHYSHALPLDLEGQKFAIVGTVSSVVERGDDTSSDFDFVVSRYNNNDSIWQLPAKIHLSWKQPHKQLKPGSIFHLLVKLKRPRNYANLGSFDLQKFYLQQRVVALGYVVNSPANDFIEINRSSHPINYIRQYLLNLGTQTLVGSKFSSIVISLVLGIKGHMPLEQMQVLQNTGIAHLMAISGLHIGLIASMVFFIIRTLWRYAPNKWLHIPAPIVAAYVSLISSIIYAALAGFSIATQRSLIMIIVFLLGTILKRNLTATHGFFLALALVLLWDPFAVLSLGFWLSFLAVGFLIFAMRGRSMPNHILAKILRYFKPQLIMTVALLPITLLFFSQSSIIAPIANMIAIPWVSFTVVPVSLIAILIMPLHYNLGDALLKLAANNFALLWPLLEWLAKFPVYTWNLPQKYVLLIIAVAVLGALWLFMPIGLPSRWWGILNFAPLFFTSMSVIPYGQADITMLDVGQGLSTIIHTKNHVLVYDTGAKINDNFDLGSRVVAPYLQAVGVKHIDLLMISHGDNDHIGGAIGLLNKIIAQDVMTSDLNDLPQYSPKICAAGQQWQWDGVIFTVLHPSQDVFNAKRNNQCCVLMVQAGQHKALLTGDIESNGEQQLVMRYGEQLQADVMLVPHHGSKTSSSLEFLHYVRPTYALIAAGYKNQYGHPKSEILERYDDFGATVLNTVTDGAISFRLGEVLLPRLFRVGQQRFWLQ